MHALCNSWKTVSCFVYLLSSLPSHGSSQHQLLSFSLEKEMMEGGNGGRSQNYVHEWLVCHKFSAHVTCQKNFHLMFGTTWNLVISTCIWEVMINAFIKYYHVAFSIKLMISASLIHCCVWSMDTCYVWYVFYRSTIEMELVLHFFHM